MDTTNSGFTATETAALSKLRNVLSDVIDSNYKDRHLIQWLRARNTDVSKAEKMFRDSLLWKKQWKIDSILTDWEAPEVLRKYYPITYLDGYAKDGSPIMCSLMGRADNRGIFQCVTPEDVLRYIFSLLERGKQEMARQSVKLGKPVTQQIVIHDMAELSFHQMFYKPVLDTTIKAIQMFEANYPECIKTIYVVNATRLFAFLYATLRPFMHENTQKKVQIFTGDSSKWTSVLLNVVDADVLPKFWGGNKTDPDGDPMYRSHLVVGGTVPKSYYRIAKTQKIKENKSLIDATINCGDQLRLDFNVTEPGMQIRYEFITQDHDIGFGIHYNDGSKEEDIVSVERVESHLGVEDGELVCHIPGIYTVIFDNTYSMMRSKTLSYNVGLFPPSDEYANNNTHL